MKKLSLLVLASAVVVSSAQASKEIVSAQCNCSYGVTPEVVTGINSDGQAKRAIANARLKCFQLDLKSLVKMRFDKQSCKLTRVKVHSSSNVARLNGERSGS